MRECDFALQPITTDDASSSDDSVLSRKNTCLLLLDAVMRVALTKKDNSPANNTQKLPSLATVNQHLTTFDTSNEEVEVALSTEECELIAQKFGAQFVADSVKVISHVAGSARRPPSETDLNIFTMAPYSITFVPRALKERKREVEKVAGTFLIQNVLSSRECSQLIAAAEAIGFSHDAVAGIDNIVLYADDSLLLPIFQRTRDSLPQSGLVGINSRFRFFRYRQGAVYRPHIGEWALSQYILQHLDCFTHITIINTLHVCNV